MKKELCVDLYELTMGQVYFDNGEKDFICTVSKC